MLSIGELAHRSGVSVRMLRHYDALGLVAPLHVDPVTGYRWYSASQVGRVNSLVALKELGFTLAQCRGLLDDRIAVDELRGMLRRRRAELERRIEDDARRLAGVERRLRAIEKGLTMTNDTLRIQSLPALRLAQVSGAVNDTSEIPAMVDALISRLAATGIGGSGIRTYHGRPDGSKIDVAVGVPVAAGSEPPAGLELARLPAVERAAVVTHGSADEDGDPWLTVDAALAERGLESHGVYRQVPVRGEVFELQCPVRDSGCRPG